MPSTNSIDGEIYQKRNVERARETPTTTTTTYINKENERTHKLAFIN